jgi:hypothetical protein
MSLPSPLFARVLLERRCRLPWQYLPFLRKKARCGHQLDFVTCGKNFVSGVWSSLISTLPYDGVCVTIVIPSTLLEGSLLLEKKEGVAMAMS